MHLLCHTQMTRQQHEAAHRLRPNRILIAFFVSTGVWLVGAATHDSGKDVTVKVKNYLCITTITIITTVTIIDTTTVIVFYYNDYC